MGMHLLTTPITHPYSVLPKEDTPWLNPKNIFMKTLAQFKLEQGIATIDLLQGKGRKYAQVKDIQLVVSKSCDLKAPVYVTQMNAPIDDTQPISEDNSKVVPGVFLLVNAANLKVCESI
jgi:hypothetical protein